jgi:CheY-like chemotaxis protein
MGGTLEVESEVGLGSVFRFVLPYEIATTPTTTAAPEALSASHLSPLDIRLVEDNPINQKLAISLLEKWGHRVILAVNGQEALDKVVAGERIDVVLMDMQMPVMDGLSATRAIRDFECEAERPITPIVMLTANALPEHVAAARVAGADRHLAKPFQAADLLALIAAPDVASRQAA